MSPAPLEADACGGGAGRPGEGRCPHRDRAQGATAGPLSRMRGVGPAQPCAGAEACLRTTGESRRPGPELGPRRDHPFWRCSVFRCGRPEGCRDCLPEGRRQPVWPASGTGCAGAAGCRGSCVCWTGGRRHRPRHENSRPGELAAGRIQGRETTRLSWQRKPSHCTSAPRVSDARAVTGTAFRRLTRSRRPRRTSALRRQPQATN